MPSGWRSCLAALAEGEGSALGAIGEIPTCGVTVGREPLGCGAAPDASGGAGAVVAVVVGETVGVTITLGPVEAGALGASSG